NRTQKLKVKRFTLNSAHKDNVIGLNGKDFDQAMGRLFYCVSLQSNDVSKSSLANGKNCLEVKQGEVALTEFFLHELNLNFDDIVEIIQVSPVAPLEPSYVVVKISGGEVFRQNRQLVSLQKPIQFWPSHLKILAEEFLKKNMDKILTWNENQQLDVVIKEYTDLTTYKQLHYEVISIKEIDTGIIRPYEYVSTETRVICENVEDSGVLIAEKLARLEKNQNNLLNGPKFELCNLTPDICLQSYYKEKERLEKEQEIRQNLLVEYKKAKVGDALIRRPVFGTYQVASSSSALVNSFSNENMSNREDAMEED
uniref:Uncharacterized protein n=1 Tax=Acrobeloides nanus TaxID=290746 RepID=A0A914C501_9BILA